MAVRTVALAAPHRFRPVVVPPIAPLLRPCRTFTCSRRRSSESPLEQFHIFRPQDDAGRPNLTIKSVSPVFFTLSDDLVVPSPLIMLAGRPLLWDVPAPPIPKVGDPRSTEWRGWDADQFLVFETVEPRPELLLFGTGDRLIQPPRWLRSHLLSRGIQLDVLDSRNAAATYNLLSEEGRRVAAALLTPVPMNARTGEKL